MRLERFFVAACVVALGLAVAYSFANAPGFLPFAIQADTLYPALLAEDLRADLGAALRFTPSRIPSFVPDLAVTVAIDWLTGSWRLAFWLWGAVAFALLAAIGGLIGRQITGRSCAAGMALVMALLLLAGLGVHLAATGARPAEVSDGDLLVNPQLLLMLPIWHGGGFILGLGVAALAWRGVRLPSAPLLAGLALLSAAAIASNTIVLAQAVLPAMIALADAAWRGAVAGRAALTVAGAMGSGSLAGLWLGAVSKRMELPVTPSASWAQAAWAALQGLAAQPVMVAMLLSALPIAWAFFRPRQAPARRYFTTVAAAASGAGLVLSLALYAGPMSWRYALPLAWWPVILAVAWLPARRLVLPSMGLAAAVVAAQGGASPAILRWQHPALVCLDAADPNSEWRAGLAAYWHARTIAASSNWRRQVESTDFGDARPLLWISDPRSQVQQRHAPHGAAPPHRFLYMAGMDPAAITALHGPPERILPCGETAIWVFPPAWQPIDQLIALNDALVPHALAVGRAVRVAPERLSPEGLALELPPGQWRFVLDGEARLRVSDAQGRALAEVAPVAEIALPRLALLRIARLDDAPLAGLVIAPARPRTTAAISR